jgi:ankyrin repeat protein
VALLIERGADINLKDYEGYTALRYARANGHTRVVEQLRAAGAKE